MERLVKLLQEPFVAALGLGVSLALLAVGVFAVPVVIARLPADYFVRPQETPVQVGHPLLVFALRVLRNLVGALLLLAGVAMLVLPGQGVLAILVSLGLLDFPGKRRLERRLLGLPGLVRVVNAIRRRAGQPPFVLHRQPSHPAPSRAG